MTDTWSMKVDNQTYGPYTIDQLRVFVAEGRVAAHSFLAPAGTVDWARAGDIPELAGLFGHENAIPPPIRPAAAAPGPAQFKTLQFPNTRRGQQDKIETLQRASSEGWRVVSETIVPGKFRGTDACCLFLICMPCAFLAGHHDDTINVTLQKG